MTLAELRAKYEAMAGEFARYGALVDGAKLCRAVAADTAAVECAAGAEILTLAQARAVSGYSDRALREMIATGKLENVGRKHAPRVRAGDLPRKAAPAAPRPATGYSADADALRLMTRGGRGAA